MEISKTRNVGPVSVKQQLNTVNRLYETQRCYDKRIEVTKFMRNQQELSQNKQKPRINSQSRSILQKSKKWKPIHKRVTDIITKTSDHLTSLRESQKAQNLEKSKKEFNAIQLQRVDNHTKSLRRDSKEWEKYYTESVTKVLKGKQEKIKDLNERYHPPVQGIPNILKRGRKRETHCESQMEEFGKRLHDHSEKREEKMNSLIRDAEKMYSFKPKINQRSKKILQKSPKKKSFMKRGVLTQRSLERNADLIQSYSTADEKVREFVKDWGDELYDPKSYDRNDSKRMEYNTKNTTEDTFSSLNFAIPQKTDDFRGFLDSYEANLSKAILVEEKYPTKGICEPTQEVTESQEASNIYEKIQEKTENSVDECEGEVLGNNDHIEETDNLEETENLESQYQTSHFNQDPPTQEEPGQEGILQNEPIMEVPETGSKSASRMDEAISCHILNITVSENSKSELRGETPQKEILRQETNEAQSIPEQTHIQKPSQDFIPSSQNPPSQIKHLDHLDLSQDPLPQFPLDQSKDQSKDQISDQNKKSIKDEINDKLSEFSSQNKIMVKDFLHDIFKNYGDPDTSQNNISVLSMPPKVPNPEGKRPSVPDQKNMEMIRGLVTQMQNRRASYAPDQPSSNFVPKSKLESKNLSPEVTKKSKKSKRDSKKNSKVSKVSKVSSQDPNFIKIPIEEHKKLLEQAQKLEEMIQGSPEVNQNEVSRRLDNDENSKLNITQSSHSNSVRETPLGRIKEVGVKGRTKNNLKANTSVNSSVKQPVAFRKRMSQPTYQPERTQKSGMKEDVGKGKKEVSLKGSKKSTLKQKSKEKSKKSSNQHPSKDLKSSHSNKSKIIHSKTSAQRYTPSVPQPANRKLSVPHNPPTSHKKSNPSATQEELLRLLSEEEALDLHSKNKQTVNLDPEEPERDEIKVEENKSGETWTEKCEQLEERVREMIKNEPEDRTERSVQRKKILGNLLSYAMSETKSAKEGSEVNQSEKGFNLPTEMIDELEEMGFETLKILGGVMDQFSYLFTDKKKKTKKR